MCYGLSKSPSVHPACSWRPVWPLRRSWCQKRDSADSGMAPFARNDASYGWSQPDQAGYGRRFSAPW
jgi:hypothetical protein